MMTGPTTHLPQRTDCQLGCSHFVTGYRPREADDFAVFADAS